ncbi:hypothetical protein COB72_09605 [bacterium]|nr:MAG: hypothetical protein COB72_09605 [bacterium]
MIMMMPSFAHAQCDPIQNAKLFPFDGQSGDRSGDSVSISGDIAVVGAWRDDENGENSGAAYVWKRVDGEWLEIAKLVASDPAVEARFGWSVSISGNFIIIGAPGVNGASIQGAAHVFLQFIGVWVEIEKFESNEGAARDFYGYSVSISGDRFIVGAPGLDDHGVGSGAGYMYELADFEWSQVGRFAPLDGQPFDRFGIGVSLSDDIAVFGARGDDDTAEDSGSAYIYTQLPGGEWDQRAKLLADDGGVLDWFGGAVAASGDTVVVGSVFNDAVGLESGSAYVYTSNDNGMNWAFNTKLVPDDGAAGDNFGYVAINGDTILAGAIFADTAAGTNSGVTYLYTRVGGSWVQRSKILPTEANAAFGVSASISDQYTIIGAPGEGLSGMAYIFDLNCPAIAADLTGDGTLNFFDVSAFLNAFAVSDPIADFTNDGQWNFFDVSAFLAAFSAGSP